MICPNVPLGYPYRTEAEKERDLEKKVKVMLLHDQDMVQEMLTVEKEIADIYYKGSGMKCLCSAMKSNMK